MASPNDALVAEIERLKLIIAEKDSVIAEQGSVLEKGMLRCTSCQLTRELCCSPRPRCWKLVCRDCTPEWDQSVLRHSKNTKKCAALLLVSSGNVGCLWWPCL